MNSRRPLVHLALGVDVQVQVVAGDAPVDHLHAADLDDAVPLGGFQTGGLGIQHHLAGDFSHQAPPRAFCNAATASRSARSLFTLP